MQYQASNFSVRWEQLGYEPGTDAAVRDLWAGEDLGVFTRSFSAEVRHLGMGAQEAGLGSTCTRVHACTLGGQQSCCVLDLC